jgi:putative ubiquitin-RnfH superfamily antitoxin RatB of RatAB toxin-antitoxin module
MPRSLPISLLLIILSVAAAQTQPPTPTEPPAAVTFTLDFPASQPEHYSIRVQSDGPSHYNSSGRISADSEDTDSFDLDFTLLPETREKIFALAAKAGYFQKDVDSHHKNLAFAGKKTLAYKDAQRSGESTYNYTNNPAVQELTTLMQSLSTTLEFGHRLQYDLHYQKLALYEELKHMEDLAHSHDLIEINAIRPVLDQLIADPTVINVTRARAQRLLEQAAH